MATRPEVIDESPLNSYSVMLCSFYLVIILTAVSELASPAGDSCEDEYADKQYVVYVERNEINRAECLRHNPTGDCKAVCCQNTGAIRDESGDRYTDTVHNI